MTNNPKQPSKPQSQPIDELVAIKQELIELRKELKTLRSGLTKQIASGTALALIVFGVLLVFLRVGLG